MDIKRTKLTPNWAAHLWYTRERLALVAKLKSKEIRYIDYERQTRAAFDKALQMEVDARCDECGMLPGQDSRLPCVTCSSVRIEA